MSFGPVPDQGLSTEALRARRELYAEDLEYGHERMTAERAAVGLPPLQDPAARLREIDAELARRRAAVDPEGGRHA
jgi:hypothetical protein